MPGRVLQGLFPRGASLGSRTQPPTPVIPGRQSGPVQPLAAGPAVQRRSNGTAFQLPPHLSNFSRSAGRPLPQPVQQKMESVFGADFSDVRIHVGPHAASIGALAFTRGSDIYFAPGLYNPSTPRGQQLLGHELTHVLQQRAGRVRNPFGSGTAVVQDQAMEAEADRMGQRAAAYPVSLQAKARPGASHPSRPVQVSAPARAGNTSYRIVARATGRPVGSVMMHARGSVIEVTDLSVSQAYRKQGIGAVLMASALRAGLNLGKSRVTLASQDNGSGRLTHWYKSMGFVQAGFNSLGHPRLEAPIRRVLSGVVQGRTAVPGYRVIQRAESSSSGGSSGRSASVLWGLFVQYKKAQAVTIEAAFLDYGYDAGNVGKAILSAITALRLDLPAHGTGGTDSGTQGDLDKAAKTWVSELTAWAATHKKTTAARKGKSGLEHSEAKRQEVAAAKAEKKETKKADKHTKWHLKNPGKKCSVSGCRL